MFFVSFGHNQTKILQADNRRQPGFRRAGAPGHRLQPALKRRDLCERSARYAKRTEEARSTERCGTSILYRLTAVDDHGMSDHEGS